jgi:hypothetical protein
MKERRCGILLIFENFPQFGLLIGGWFETQRHCRKGFGAIHPAEVVPAQCCGAEIAVQTYGTGRIDRDCDSGSLPFERDWSDEQEEREGKAMCGGGWAHTECAILYCSVPLAIFMRAPAARPPAVQEPLLAGSAGGWFGR